MDGKKATNVSSQGKRQVKKKAIIDENESARAYFTWTLEMDTKLADILRDQRIQGNKCDGSWKSIAYNTAAFVLSSQFNVSILGDNVKSRVKIWKKWYGIVSDILGQSGFNWDGTTCMVTVNESAWDDYVKSHPDAKCFRFKVIPIGMILWIYVQKLEPRDMVLTLPWMLMCISMWNKIMEKVVKKVKLIPQLVFKAKRKRIRGNDELAIAVGKIANSFTEFVRSSEKKIDVKEVMYELNMISDFDRQQRLKALKWLTENETQFSVAKNLPSG
ncbi:hypothetical protein COLO4_16082 [Corchorus olitorius]|uniref:Myb/SANT-like domain-containing protein n=1 Tax=Corchorus olitorius TaxID=93759 RepID=A0A1R3JJS4_9ROSI|nr:hypothetical protein COLO4_16082 [Corchorus olitorius]